MPKITYHWNREVTVDKVVVGRWNSRENSRYEPEYVFVALDGWEAHKRYRYDLADAVLAAATRCAHLKVARKQAVYTVSFKDGREVEFVFDQGRPRAAMTQARKLVKNGRVSHYRTRPVGEDVIRTCI